MTKLTREMIMASAKKAVTKKGIRNVFSDYKIGEILNVYAELKFSSIIDIVSDKEHEYIYYLVQKPVSEYNDENSANMNFPFTSNKKEFVFYPDFSYADFSRFINNQEPNAPYYEGIYLEWLHGAEVELIEGLHQNTKIKHVLSKPGGPYGKNSLRRYN